jgi:hypothetical protein
MAGGVCRLKQRAGCREVKRSGVLRVDYRPRGDAALRSARYPDVDLAAGLSESDCRKKNKK